MAAYTEQLGDEICRLTVDSSLGLKHICRQLGQPYDTVKDWIYKDLHGFADKYARAKQLQAQRMASELLEIADDNSEDRKNQTVHRARLRTDIRKWLMTNLDSERSAGNTGDAKFEPATIIIKKSHGSQFPPGDETQFQNQN